MNEEEKTPAGLETEKIDSLPAVESEANVQTEVSAEVVADVTIIAENEDFKVFSDGRIESEVKNITTFYPWQIAELIDNKENELRTTIKLQEKIEAMIGLLAPVPLFVSEHAAETQKLEGVKLDIDIIEKTIWELNESVERLLELGVDCKALWETKKKETAAAQVAASTAQPVIEESKQEQA